MSKKDIERIVAKIEGEKSGNAFLIDNKRVATVKHCLSNLTEKVKLVFPKLQEGEVIEREAVVCEQFGASEDGWVLMEMEDDIDAPSVKIASMCLQPYEETDVFGYDSNYLPMGKWTKFKSAASMIPNPDLLQDMLFDPVDSQEKDFSGLSGSPIVKGNCIIGIVSQETLENSQAISIHGISVKSSMDFFKRYDIQVKELTDAGEYRFEVSMGLGNEKGNGKSIAIGGEQEIQNRLQGIYKDKLTNIVVLHRRGDIDSAWEELKEQLIEIEKDSYVNDNVKAEYYYRMALWLLEDREDVVKAKKRHEKAKRLNSELDDSIFQALLELKTGNKQNVEEVLEPVDSVAKFNVYLQICINTQKPEKAYDKFIEVEPIIVFDSSSYYLLSVLAILLRNFDEAEKHINRAIDLDRKVPFYHLIKGIISYWRAIPDDMFLAEDLYPVMFVNGLLHLNGEQQKFIRTAINDYNQAYRLAGAVENKDQMDFILGVWVNTLSVDSAFQNDIQEPLQLLKNSNPFSVTVLLYSLQKGMVLDEKVTIDSLEQHVKKSKNKLGHVVALVELCLLQGEKKRAKSFLHEYKPLFFNEKQYGHWYEAIIKVEEDKDKLRKYEEEIETNDDLGEIQHKQLLALFMQLERERDEELECLLNEIYEKTRARIDLLNLIFFYKTRRKWKKMQMYAELLLNKYSDTYGSMYKIQSLIEQQEYEQALDVIEEVKGKEIVGTKIELLRNQMHVYERMGRYAEAINCGCELLKEKPTEQNILNLSSLYALNGDESAVLNTLIKAEEHDVLTTTICQRICSCYLTKDSKKAWEYAQKAVELSGDQPEIMLWASNIAHRVGRSDAGGTYLHRVMVEYPNQQLLMVKSLDEVLELLRESREETQRNIQMLYDGELPSHIFVDANRNQTYAEFFYAQWNDGTMAPMEFGAHYYQDQQINLDMRRIVLDYSSCLLLHEVGLLELLCEDMEKIYIAGDLFGVMSEEIRNIPELQPEIIDSKYHLVQRCKNEFHIKFVEVKLPDNDLSELDAEQVVNAINTCTARYHNALFVSHDKNVDGIHESEVIVALYRSGKITQGSYEKYEIEEDTICENNVQKLLHDASKLLVDEVVISKWVEFSVLPAVISNYTVVVEDSMVKNAEQGMEQLRNKNRICEQVEQVKSVLQKYNEQNKLSFIPMEERDKFVYSNMLKTVMTAAENMGIPLCVDDRVVTSYSCIGKVPIYNSFDLIKMMHLQKRITLEKYVEIWQMVLDKKVRYLLPDNSIILHALTLSEIDEERGILEESEILRKIRQYVVEALSAKSSLSTKQVAHVHIPEREYFIFLLQSNSRELLRSVWMSQMSFVKKRMVSNWILRHYSQFAFDFSNQINDKGRMTSHAIQLADFLIAGILLTSDEMCTKEYYGWLYEWIATYLEQNTEIKEKMLNYTREFICSFLRDSARSKDKKEHALIKQMFALGIYYMPEEYREEMLRDKTISQVFHSRYAQISVVLTNARHIPAELFKTWESEVLALKEKEVLTKLYCDVVFQFSWEYVLPAFPGIVVKWQEGEKMFERRILIDIGARLKHESKTVRKNELQQITKYLENVDYGKANLELLNLCRYKNAAEEILGLLFLSKEFEQARIKKGIEENWFCDYNTWKYLLPSNADFFKQLYDYDGNNTATDDLVAGALPVEFGKNQVGAVDNHNPVRLLHRLSWLLETGADDIKVMSAISTLLNYTEIADMKYRKAYILLLKSTWILFGNISVYEKEKIENLQMWAYIWSDMMMTELCGLVESRKIDLDTFIIELQEDMRISYETDGILADMEEEDVLSPYYMNLYRLCVTGTLSLCWLYKDRIKHLLKDVLNIFDKSYKNWLTVAIHVSESELHHKSETNIYQSIFSENGYVLIGCLAKSCNCNDIFLGIEDCDMLENRRRYFLNEMLKDNALEQAGLCYLAIISRESILEDDAVLVQKIIEKQVLEKDVVIEEGRYSLLIRVVNRLSLEFQEKFVKHEFIRVGNMLRQRNIDWEQAECIVTEIATFKGLDKYLDFWDEYEDVLDEDVALQLAEKIGQMQYMVPYELMERMRELRIRLELPR